MRLIRTLTPLFLLAAAMPAAGLAEPVPEYQLKSGFVYNFATFIDWPASLGTSLLLCVAVPDAGMKYFKALDGKSVGKMTLEVRRLAPEDSAADCRILYVADSESAGFDDWLSDISDEYVLTLAESGLWLKKGAVVSLAIQDSRVVFDINMNAARGERLLINSRLLRMARKVIGMEAQDERAQ